jgi:hypothetical protein
MIRLRNVENKDTESSSSKMENERHISSYVVKSTLTSRLSMIAEAQSSHVRG